MCSLPSSASGSTSSREGQRVAARRPRRPASCSSGTSIRNGRMVVAVAEVTVLLRSLTTHSGTSRTARRRAPRHPMRMIRGRPGHRGVETDRRALRMRSHLRTGRPPRFTARGAHPIRELPGALFRPRRRSVWRRRRPAGARNGPSRAPSASRRSSRSLPHSCSGRPGHRRTPPARPCIPYSWRACCQWRRPRQQLSSSR